MFSISGHSKAEMSIKQRGLKLNNTSRGLVSIGPTTSCDNVITLTIIYDSVRTKLDHFQC
jgi:hypothetical protein